jgi:phosphate-selective porin OprO/OprP
MDKPDTIGRVTANVAEVMGRKDVITHVGLGYSVGTVAGFTPASGRTEAREDSAFFTANSTSSPVRVGSTRTRMGLEAALAYDAFKLQGEYVRVSYDTTGTAAAPTERGLNATYMQAVWNITGENHNYSNSAGTFGWIKPKQAFSAEKGGLGAWQVGVRYSKLQAGEFNAATGFTNGAGAWTYGLTWFVNDNARMMLNYVDTTYNTNIGTAAANNLRSNQKAIMARAQYFF